MSILSYIIIGLLLNYVWAAIVVYLLLPTEEEQRAATQSQMLICMLIMGPLAWLVLFIHTAIRKIKDLAK